MPIYYFNIIAKRQIKLLLKLGCAVLLITILGSCRDLFEKDISEEAPQLILPTNKDTLNSNLVHFKWAEMDGASFYNLQIVRPSFSDISTFLLDSNINDEEFYQILAPGDYQFKLRGENGAYLSNFAGPYSIYVDSVSDLSAQFVSLVSPADEIYINGTSDLLLSWQNLFAAENYEYILKIGDDFSTASVLDVNSNIVTLNYTADASFFNVEGIYYWGIKGLNLTSSTSYSYRSILVDLTAPNNPSLIAPTDIFTHSISDPLTLKWSTGTDPGEVNSPVYSSVEISTSEEFTDVELFEGITADSLVHTFLSTGNYWWRVKSIDGVGNESEAYSSERQITVE